MFRFGIRLMMVVMFAGIGSLNAYGSLVSYLFIGDTGYTAEGVDMDYIDIYDNDMGSKTADIYGGLIGTVGSSFSSTVNLYDECIVEHIRAEDSSMVNIFDGSLATLTSHDFSRVNIFGGVFDDYDVLASVYSFDYSHVTISGGTFADDLKASENSIITICGTDFSIDGLSVGYGPITTASGILAGTLANGELMSNNFYISDDAGIFLVPEPGTVFLLGLGGLALIRKRKFAAGRS